MSEPSGDGERTARNCGKICVGERDTRRSPKGGEFVSEVFADDDSGRRRLHRLTEPRRGSSCAEGGDLLGEGRGADRAAPVRGELVGEGRGRVLFALQSQVPRQRILVNNFTMAGQ